jgi:hypothetical protein
MVFKNILIHFSFIERYLKNAFVVAGVEFIADFREHLIVDVDDELSLLSFLELGVFSEHFEFAVHEVP